MFLFLIMPKTQSLNAPLLYKMCKLIVRKRRSNRINFDFSRSPERLSNFMMVEYDSLVSMDFIQDFSHKVCFSFER